MGEGDTPLDMKPWIFVLGFPRSGSTFLRELLSSHQDLYISPEVRILDLLKLAGALSDVGSAKLKTNRPRVSARGLSLGKSFARIMAHYQLQEHGAQRYGDAFDGNSLSIPEITMLFSDARIVHIIRDGRDVLASWLQDGGRTSLDESFSQFETISSFAQQWVRLVQQARTAGLALSSGRYLELRYEDLVSNPIGTTRELLAFLGESVDVSVLDAAGDVPRQPAWQESLTSDELHEFMSCEEAGTLLLELGYPTPEPPQDVEPMDGDHWFRNGQVLLVEGETQDAIHNFQRAVRGSSFSADACASLLSLSSHPASESMAEMVRTSNDPQVLHALQQWAHARGLSREDALRLFAEPPA